MTPYSGHTREGLFLERPPLALIYHKSAYDRKRKESRSQSVATVIKNVYS